MRRIRTPLMWVVVAFLVYAVLKSPDQAATMVRTGWDGILSGLKAIGHFFDALLAR